MKEIHIRKDISTMNDRFRTCHDKPVETHEKSLPSIKRSNSANCDTNDVNVVEECTVELELLSIMAPMRPRANTDPFSQLYRSSLPVLPEIFIEDYSTTVEKNPENAKSCTAAGAFFVVASPPRRRANTCPDDFFRRPRVRPLTPPPTMLKDNGGSLHSSREKMRTKHHKLKKVTEDVRIDGDEDANMACSDRASLRKKVKVGAETGIMHERLSRQKNKQVISVDKFTDIQKRETKVAKTKILNKMINEPRSLPKTYTEQREAS